MMVASKARIMSALQWKKRIKFILWNNFQRFYNEVGCKQSWNKRGIRYKKIREKLIKACENLEVNMIELESHIDAIYQEGITTKIQEALITQAVAMVSFEESDWTYVAGRLLMMETEREVFS